MRNWFILLCLTIAVTAQGAEITKPLPTRMQHPAGILNPTTTQPDGTWVTLQNCIVDSTGSDSAGAFITVNTPPIKIYTNQITSAGQRVDVTACVYASGYKVVDGNSVGNVSILPAWYFQPGTITYAANLGTIGSPISLYGVTIQRIVKTPRTFIIVQGYYRPNLIMVLMPSIPATLMPGMAVDITGTLLNLPTNFKIVVNPTVTTYTDTPPPGPPDTAPTLAGDTVLVTAAKSFTNPTFVSGDATLPTPTLSVPTAYPSIAALKKANPAQGTVVSLSYLRVNRKVGNLMTITDGSDTAGLYTTTTTTAVIAYIVAKVYHAGSIFALIGNTGPTYDPQTDTPAITIDN